MQQRIELFLNDEAVDLSQDDPIALTFQINNLQEVQNQQGNTSNQFKIPLMARNRHILGFPSDIRFTNELPYRRYSAKIIQDGVEIVPVGFAELNECNGGEASITVLSGNVDFFDLLDGKLQDMYEQFEKYKHAYSIDNIAASQTKTSGWIWPVINYGTISGETIDEVLDVNFFRPAFFLHTLVDEIIASTGYAAKGSLLADPLYKRILIPFANDRFIHSQNYLDQLKRLNYQGQTLADQVYDVSGTNTERAMSFSDIIDIENIFDGTAYQINDYANLKVSLKFTVTLSAERDVYFSGVFLQVYPDGKEYGLITLNPDNTINQVGTASWTAKDETTFADNLIEFEYSFQPGTKLIFKMTTSSTYAAKYNFKAGAKLTITQSENVIYGQMVSPSDSLPDLTQRELLKDTFQKFGIICQSNNITNEITFLSFADIVNNIPIAKDWSSKVVNQGVNINYRLGEYAQVNTMKYKEDSAVSPSLGASKITIDDKTLNQEYEMIESVFAASESSIFQKFVKVTKIEKVDPTDEKKELSISTEPRVLVDNKINKTVSIKYGANNDVVKAVNTISAPTFDELDFENLRTKYYSELEHILKRAKKVLRYILLTPIDIAQLDLSIPVYIEQDGAYYYINKIDSYIKGKPTKVELIRL